ncbi:hypothetical protein C5167_017131 [Papaver somniferum]|uniref:Phospholipid/glycerol acyltransferase domain-containing protein n=1 Tax=Papaver somniferum TaxID=3469 RepID=A0A4Y7IML7_PAPSO|nr:probable glycerol-3-phosphate acyltransferase 3 isoform X1 [Papaver somniferum]XP_026446287.1 probable glycerol-3-phosphate acyltransferase 3 isoform X1 [Papaver somniferum]RZC48705.1 hypothetical protein C5167_017131 [Papaver somniferum]
MAEKEFCFKTLLLFVSRIFHRRLLKNTHFQQRSNRDCYSNALNIKIQKYPSLILKSESESEFSSQTLIFDVEGALLKPSSLFHYFMLVAFEAGGLVRALVLLLLYPIIWLVNEDIGMNIMVFVCFFGIKKDNFRVGRSVLPKFVLEDVGYEGFEVLMRYGKKVGVSELPRVMIEAFLRDYLEVDFVVGKELKVFHGYFVGLMEDATKTSLNLQAMFGEEKMNSKEVVGFGSFHKSLEHHYFSQCKEIYLVNETEKKKWKNLPREKYPKPLVFHDGRLAFKPTPISTLVMFIWIPFGIFLFTFRFLIGISLPYSINTPILAFSGMRLKQSKPIPTPKKIENQKGVLYVSNHRTLMDPIYVSGGLRKQLTAMIYSLSKACEIVAPIKTVRLTRDRETDAEMMEKMLKQGDVAVCPEGTTCREPYLLRFSPLFAEVSDEIIPVAIHVEVGMFYGTTASGYKVLDPLFFFMNPHLTYSIKFLEKISTSEIFMRKKSRTEVANYVQGVIGRALGFECTNLTRKHKYLMLAGNEGFVGKSKSSNNSS